MIATFETALMLYRGYGFEAFRQNGDRNDWEAPWEVETYHLQSCHTGVSFTLQNQDDASKDTIDGSFPDLPRPQEGLWNKT